MSGAKFLKHRAASDVLREPGLAGRVADYLRVVGGAGRYLTFVLEMWTHEEQVYADVNHIIAEGLLRVEPNRNEAKAICKVAMHLLRGRYSMPGADRCTAIAPLLLLRYGQAGTERTLRGLVRRVTDASQPAIAKAMVAVYVSFGRAAYYDAVDVASRLRQNHLAHFLTMLGAVAKYETVPERFKIRRDPGFDLVANKKRIDLRKLVALRLLRLNSKPAVRRWIRETRDWMAQQPVSTFDRQLVRRLL
jgi:hypothetical protein